MLKLRIQPGWIWQHGTGGCGTVEPHHASVLLADPLPVADFESTGAGWSCSHSNLTDGNARRIIVMSSRTTLKFCNFLGSEIWSHRPHNHTSWCSCHFCTQLHINLFHSVCATGCFREYLTTCTSHACTRKNWASRVVTNFPFIRFWHSLGWLKGDLKEIAMLFFSVKHSKAREPHHHNNHNHHNHHHHHHHHHTQQPIKWHICLFWPAHWYLPDWQWHEVILHFWTIFKIN